MQVVWVMEVQSASNISAAGCQYSAGNQTFSLDIFPRTIDHFAMLILLNCGIA